MPDDLITPENLSTELLKSALDAAYVDVSYDSDGDLKVEEDIWCFVTQIKETRDRIGIQAFFGFLPDASELNRLQFVNNSNSRFIIARASSRPNNVLHFGYDIVVSGGITKKAFVLTLKRFCGIPRLAIREFGSGVVK